MDSGDGQNNRNKENVVYPHNGILFINKKKWSSDTCYNMDEPWKYYAKFKKKKANHKRLHIVGFHLHEMSSISKSKETESQLVVA